MSTLKDISRAIYVLKKFGTKKKNITLLHCNTEYPTPIKDVNLLAIKVLKRKFDVKVGYSDHTDGIAVPIAAVAMGATVIEKHLTLDRNLSGPDHKASLEPSQFADMVAGIRIIQQAMGDGLKRPTQSEKNNTPHARRSLVAKNSIEPGDIFTIDNLTAKRPGNGVSPMKWDEYIGKQAKNYYQIDDPINE